MKEEKRNPLIELRERLQELSGGLCDIGPGPYGIGADAIDSEVGFYLIFEPKCYTEDEIFPEAISEYKVSVEGFHQRSLEKVKPEELEKLAESNETNTAVTARTLKELSGKEIRVSREECIEAFGLMADAIMEGLKADGTFLDSEGQEEMGMSQQL